MITAAKQRSRPPSVSRKHGPRGGLSLASKATLDSPDTGRAPPAAASPPATASTAAARTCDLILMESSPGAPAQCRTGSSPLSSPVRHTDYTYPYLSTDRPWHGPHREHYLHSKKYLKLRQQVAALVSKPRRLTDDDARPAVLSPASCSIRPAALPSRAERRLLKGAAGAAEAGLVADRLSQFLDSEMPATPSPPSRRPARPVLTRRPITAPESPRPIPNMKLVDLGSPRSEPLLPSHGSLRQNSVPTAEPTVPMPNLSAELSRRRLLAREEAALRLSPFVDSTASLPFEAKPPTVLFTKSFGRRAAKQKPVEQPVRAMRPLNPPVPTRYRSVGGDSLRSSVLHRSSAQCN